MFCAGIDTHKDFHVLVIADELGREIYHESFSADEQGICSLTSALSDRKSTRLNSSHRT